MLALRQWIYHFIPPVELPCFVLSVGNLSMGGTGKSSMVMEIAQYAVEQGIRVAVLSRGYGRKSRHLKIVMPHAPLPGPEEIGDEPWMIRHRIPGIALLVHADRGRMASRHWNELGKPQLVILDDGFQHWKVARDCDLVMVDAGEAIGRPIPFGKMREPIAALGRAELVIISRFDSVPPEILQSLKQKITRFIRSDQHAPWKRKRWVKKDKPIISSTYSFLDFLDIASGKVVQQPERVKYLLLAGIAKPDGFRALAKSLNIAIEEEVYFPDHHILQTKDIERIRSYGLPLLITEKDWARWRDSLISIHAQGLVIRVKVDFPDGQPFKEFLAEVKRCSTSA